MKEASRSHLVLIPSYNPGERVYETVQAARRFWNPVWVVVDASTDGTAEGLRRTASADPGLKVIVLPTNGGKGAAVLHGIELAQEAGFTHVLTMDSDGQHPAEMIGEFMAASAAEPSCMVLGVPVFDSSAPNLRVKGRRVSNWWANLDQLWMRRFDFDPEAVVRMCWLGVRPLNRPAPVQYFHPGEGGVSHFNYWRDNALLTWMHVRLLLGFVLRLPLLAIRRLRTP